MSKPFWNIPEEITEELEVLRDCLRYMTQLLQRSSCPCCHQPLTVAVTEADIAAVRGRIDRLEERKRSVYQRQQPELDRRNRERKKFREKVYAYYRQNQKLLKRHYTANTHPSFTASEDQRLWNEAMEMYIEEHGIDEADYPFFNVLKRCEVS